MKTIKMVIAKTMNTDVVNNLPVHRPTEKDDWMLDVELIGTISDPNEKVAIMSMDNLRSLLKNARFDTSPRRAFEHISEQALETINHIETEEERAVTMKDVQKFARRTIDIVEFMYDVVEIKNMDEILP